MANHRIVATKKGTNQKDSNDYELKQNNVIV